jgi:hypothetical protein
MSHGVMRNEHSADVILLRRDASHRIALHVCHLHDAPQHPAAWHEFHAAVVSVLH